jgi:hypothetical protein
MSEPLTNKAWEKLFEHLDISNKVREKGIVYLTSKDIKNISSREPRLMCKFDERDSRSKILKNNGITILPVKNGEYALIDGDGYQNLPSILDSIQFFEWPFEKRLETLPKEPRSESQVIDMALATGLISHFLEDYDLTLTIRGRLRSSPFKFTFQGTNKVHELNVDGVQIEVDAGFEGEKIYLIEAKMGERDDFHVRQLFYPMKMWMEEGVTKEIVPLFITYANEIISVSQYRFNKVQEYSSIELVKTLNYTFEPNPLTLTLPEIIQGIKVQKMEPDDIPFPQADDIRKVRDTVDLITWGCDTRDQIAKFWEVAPRQGDYYANAGQYLGLVRKDDKHWRLTSKGEVFVHLPTTQRNKMLAEVIFQHPVFYEAQMEYLKQSLSSREEVAKLIQKFSNKKFSESTLLRRALTIMSWVEYINFVYKKI